MKIIVSIIGWLVILVPFSSFFVILGVISLEMGFGITPPIGLATVCFVLAIIYGIFWRIGAGMKPFLKFANNNPRKRLLSIRFYERKILREKEENI